MNIKFVKVETDESITYEFGKLDYETLVLIVKDYPEVETIYGANGDKHDLIADKRFLEAVAGEK